MTYTRDMNAMQGHASPDTPVQGNPTRIWTGEVVTVNPDGTIDVRPLQSRATKNSLTSPTWYAAAVGDQVLVCDLNGDPRTPTVIAPIGALTGVPTIKAQTLGAAGGDLQGTFPSPTVNWGGSGHLAWAAPARCYRAGAYTATVYYFNPGYWDTVSYDPGSNLHLSGGVYTYKVPATGYYTIATTLCASAGVDARAIVSICTANSDGSFLAEIVRGADLTVSGNWMGATATSTELLTVGTYISGSYYPCNGNVALAVSASDMCFSIVRVA